MRKEQEEMNKEGATRRKEEEVCRNEERR